TMFETLDITGTTIDFEAGNKNVTAGLETGIKLMLRAGGTWYLSDTIVDILDIVGGERRPYSFDPAASTWDQLGIETNVMLDALADGDEADVNAIDTSVMLDAELANVTGGGFLHATSPGENSAVRIDEVVWTSDPWITIGGGTHDDEWTHITNFTFNPSIHTAPGTGFVPGRQDKGWNAITNVEASEPGMTWAWTVTGYVGAADPGTAMSEVLFKRNNVDNATDVIDPNIVFPYKGTYELELVGDNGTRSDVATITNYVLENRAPRVNSFGTLNRTRYDGATITLNPNCQDDNYPLTDPLVTQRIRLLDPDNAPAPITFFYNGHSRGWSPVTSVNSFVGIGKGHPLIDDRSPEDPNVTFPVGFVGVYKFVAHSYDGDLWSWQGDRDPNQTVTVTVRDNQAMEEVIAGEDLLGVKNRDLVLEGTIIDPDFEGTVDDDDITTRPENNAIKWTVESGPGGAGFTFGDDTTLNSTVQFDTPGDYTLKLTVTETSLSTGVIEMEDFVNITIFSAKVKIKTIKPSDDTSIRYSSSEEDKNYGGELELYSKTGTGGGNRKAFVKFDLNQIPGVVKKTAATFSIMSAESQNDANTIIEAATYGEGGEWFEGDGMQQTNVTAFPDTTGVGLTSGSDAVPVTGKTLDFWVAQDMGGPEAWPNNTRNTFDVSEMVIELDNKVTFRINSEHTGRKDFHSKEAGLDGDGIERAPLLRVAYDPNEPFFPAPYDGALQVPVTIAQLGWKLFGADKATEECEVFFGTDPSPSVSIG
ncbi:MAG: DNRLRE domain-containing protein, partial [Planctomycetes bacterium]|nr:DNRLRE domain-containing protein [Planctomycetota bacterium]